MVVISLITSLGGGALPSTASSATDGLSPPPLFTVASPPLATTYRITSAPGVSWLPSSNRPSAFVLACASCLGSPALAAQSVTVEFASAPPPACTCPSIRTAAAAGPQAQPSRPRVDSTVTSPFLSILTMSVLRDWVAAKGQIAGRASGRPD